MATDIAFSLAVLAFLKDKIPRGLRIFLTAFAIADDLGAVIVIALFYTKTIVWQNLIFSTLFFSLPWCGKQTLDQKNLGIYRTRDRHVVFNFGIRYACNHSRRNCGPFHSCQGKI